VKLWKALKSDRTFMPGLASGKAGDSQPMTGLKLSVTTDRTMIEKHVRGHQTVARSDPKEDYKDKVAEVAL
jgi:hypothetical protein